MPEISNVMRSRDLFQLADCLEQFIQYVNSLNKKKDALLSLYERLYMEDFFRRLNQEPYIVFEHEESVLLFLKNRWLFQKTSKENLNEIIKEIRDTISEPQKPLLDITTIEELMHLIEGRFSFASNILKDHPIQILCLNHTHKICNSFYSARIYSDEKIEDAIIITSLKHNVDFPKEFIFLHEMGHLLHTRITKILMTPPESFRAIQKIMFQKSLNDPPEVSAELFADCFAIAALYDSKFSQYNPYTEIYDSDNYLLVMYMLNLIDEVKAKKQLDLLK